MREVLKTVGFVGAAVLVVSITWLSRPAPLVSDAEDLQGKRLFPDFNDPLAATSMEIVEFDQDSAEARPFTVAQADLKGEGKPLWSIPTHENYPADARDQVSDAAGGLMGLTIRKLASSSPGDHEEYGVVDPDPNKRKGTTGVGTRVTMKNDRGKVLMSLIIGKEVPDRTELRYVRKTGKDPVYIVKVSTDKLSAKFEDWIEEDLLKLTAWDIEQIRIRDHAVDELNMELIQRGEMTLEYDDTGDTKWKLIKDEVLQNGEWVPQKIAEDEELDTDKLDDLKNALDNLEIVDVSRKPPGLSGDLKAATDFTNNDQARQSLARRGFYVARVGNRVELFSNEGEIRCLMKDGVEYVLRFGEIAGAGSAAPKEKEDEDEGSGSSGLNRFIFVMTEFNRDSIPEPELEPLPGEEEKPAEGQPAKGESPEEENGTQKSPDGESADEPSQEKTNGQPAEVKTNGQPAEEKTNGQPAEEKTNGQPAEEKADGQPADENADETAEKKKDQNADGAETDEESDIEAKREEIEKENRQKRDEYEEKIEEGRKKVKELNERFADWYYVISDEVYQKIHLGHDQIIKKKEKEEEEGEEGEEPGTDPGTDPGAAGPGESADPTSPLDEFRRLKQEGPGGSQGPSDVN